MKPELFAELLESVREGGAILRGEMEAAYTVSSNVSGITYLREKHNLTQSQFAKLLGISVATLRNWEQGRRKPEGPARRLLQIAADYPEVVFGPETEPRRRTRRKELAPA